MADRTKTLRDVLRAGTREEHERVDAAFSELDLADAEDFATFLKAHHGALSVMEAALEGALELPALPARLGLIEADLEAMGDRAEHHSDEGFRHHLTGAAYVIAGSALGTEVLRRRWAEAPEAKVALAHRFINDERLAAYWREMRPLLADQVPEKEEEAILEGARATFALYARSLERVRSRTHI